MNLLIFSLPSSRGIKNYKILIQSVKKNTKIEITKKYFKKLDQTKKKVEEVTFPHLKTNNPT